MSTMKCSLVAAMSVAFAALSAAASEQLSLNLDSSYGPKLAFSTDMTMVAVGRNYPNDNNSTTTPVKVYKRQTDNHFEKVDEVVSIGDSFGRGVGLSGDGKFLAVGNPEEATRNEQKPSFLTVYDLTRNTKLASLKSEYLGDSYGASVAMNGDGTKMVVGTLYGGGDNKPGQLYIYNKNGDSYQLEQVITGKNGFGYIGTAVSMSTDGSRVSGYADNARPGDDFSRSPFGATSVFEYDAATGTYTQLGSDIVGNEGDGYDGISFGLSGDGNTLAMGYFNENRSEAVIYKYQEGDWKEHSVIPLGKLDTSSNTYTYAGFLKLNEDGNTAYVGRNVTLSFSAYNWNGNSWIENLAGATGTAAPAGTAAPEPSGSTRNFSGSASYLWVIFACAQILSGWN